MTEYTGFSDLLPSENQNLKNIEIAGLKNELKLPETTDERKQEICNILNSKHGIPSIQFGNSVVCKDGKYTGVKIKEKIYKYDYSKENMDRVIGLIQDGKSLPEISKEVKIPLLVLSTKLSEMGLSYRKIREEYLVKKADEILNNGVHKGKMVKSMEKSGKVGRECKYDWTQPNIDRIVAMIKENKKMTEISKIVGIPSNLISGKLSGLGLNKRRLLASGEVKESTEQKVIKEVKDAKKEQGVVLAENKSDEKINRRRFTEEEKVRAIAMREEGKGYLEIGKEFGVGYWGMWTWFKNWGLTGSKQKPIKVKTVKPAKVSFTPETEKLITGKSETRKIVEREENIPVGNGRNVIIKVNVVEGGTQVLIHIPTIA